MRADYSNNRVARFRRNAVVRYSPPRSLEAYGCAVSGAARAPRLIRLSQSALRTHNAVGGPDSYFNAWDSAGGPTITKTVNGYTVAGVSFCPDNDLCGAG